MNKRFYTIAQWTWGLPQTLIGAAVYFRHRGEKHFDYNGARVTEWDNDSAYRWESSFSCHVEWDEPA